MSGCFACVWARDNHGGPPDFGRGNGRAAEQYEGSTGGRKAFSWIRFDNTEPARASRREIRNITRRAVAAGGYVSNGKKVELVHISSMLDNTRTLAPSLGNLDMPSGNAVSSRATLISKPKGVVLDVAMELNKRYRGRVGIVSAASTYHCGGGFRTGGRHALEEAICVQTPLYASICKVREGLLGPGCHDSRDKYIPTDGVILSPDIEVFRGGSDEGYPFFERPVPLAAVISVAMFNCNPAVTDAPLDCPDDTDVYEELLRGKFRSVLAAAVEANCQALVMPDVGCGVYKNDPKIVGMVFGQVLKEEFWGKIKEVALTGTASFQSTVEEVTNKESESEPESQ